MQSLIFLIVFTAFAGGSVAPFAKSALEVFQPFTLIFIRFLTASLALLPFVYKNRELNFTLFKELFGVALIGAFNPILLFIALQFTPSSVSPLIYAAVPMMTALYLGLVKNVKIPSGKVRGIITGFIGVSVIILLPFFQRGLVDLKSFWGNLLILGAAVSFMMYGVISKEKQRRHNISPLALTFYFSLVTLIISIPFLVYENVWHPLNLEAIGLRHILAGLETGLVGTSLFYLAYQKAISKGSELTASLFTYLQPIATIFFAWLLLGEKITLPFVFGGVLAVIGARMGSLGSVEISG